MLKLFGDKKQNPKELLEEILSEILEKGGFSLSFQLEEKEKNQFLVDIFGEDEGLLKAREGRFLLSLQSYLLKVLCKAFPEEEIRLVLDSNGFWEETEKRLLSLVDRLVKKVLETNRPTFIKKSLSPRQRRVVHERVSGNTGVRSQSLGEGPYKTMKLVPEGAHYRRGDK